MTGGLTEGSDRKHDHMITCGFAARDKLFTRPGNGEEGANVLAHTQHAVDLGDSQPVQDVRHQRLETHVLDAGDVLGALKVVRGAVLASLAGVVHDCVCGRCVLVG